MLRQPLPSSAEAYAQEQRVEIQAAVAASRRLWRRVSGDLDASYAAIEPDLLRVADLAQERVAVGAQAYIPAVLDETGQRRSIDPFAEIKTTALVGVAGDGRPVDSMLYGAVVNAKVRIAAGDALPEALRSSSSWLSTAMGTLLSDTGRASESLATGVRPVGGYVRMLNPPSCSRCVVQAGKFFRKNAGFLRHPGCDCRHIPASEAMAGDLTVDPVRYFDSLTPAEQDRTFTKAGADALRADANMGQVVNARRGMRTAQVYGRDVVMTSDGATRRGIGYKRMRDAGYAQKQTDVRVKGERYFRARAPRLMPETIQQIATDRDDYLRLLKLYGYMG